MTTSTLRDLCKAEAAVAMSAKTLRWGRAGESIRAGPQFSCRQVEGLRDVPRRLSLSLHSHSCPLKPQRSTLLLNNPPWLSPSTR